MDKNIFFMFLSIDIFCPDNKSLMKAQNRQRKNRTKIQSLLYDFAIAKLSRCNIIVIAS